MSTQVQDPAGVNPESTPPRNPPPRSLVHDPLLAKLSVTQQTQQAFFESLSRRICAKIGAIASVFWMRGAKGKLDCLGAFSTIPGGSRLTGTMLENAKVALKSGNRLFIYPRAGDASGGEKNPNDTPHAWVFEVISSAGGASGTALFLFDPKIRASDMRARLQQAGDIGFYIDTNEASRIGKAASANNRHLSRCLSFAQSLAGNLSDRDLSMQVANDLRDLAHCERASIFDWRRSGPVLRAVSGLTTVERASQETRALEHATAELLRDEDEALASPESDARPAIRKFSDHSDAKSLLALAAKSDDGHRTFAVLLESISPGHFATGDGAERAEHPPLSSARWAWLVGARALAACRKYNSLPLVKTLGGIQRIREDLAAGRRTTRYRVFGVFGAVAILICVMPWREKSVGDCLLLPAQRGVVVAEETGRVAEVSVREGSLVKAGDIVAKLDTREAETQLQVIHQDRLKLEAESRLYQASGDLGAYQVSFLQLRRAIESERKLREDIERSTLRAPMDGVVLTKDVDLRRGSILQTGDPICEVASLDNWDLQISIPEADYGLMRKSLDHHRPLPVEYLLYARSGLTLHGQITSLENISQMTYTEKTANVFYGTIPGITLPPELREEIRPGFSGKARVLLDHSPLVVVLTRKFIHFLRVNWLV